MLSVKTPAQRFGKRVRMSKQIIFASYYTPLSVLYPGVVRKLLQGKAFGRRDNPYRFNQLKSQAGQEKVFLASLSRKGRVCQCLVSSVGADPTMHSFGRSS